MRKLFLTLMFVAAWSVDADAAAPDPCAALLQLSLESAADTPVKILEAVAVPATTVSDEEWTKYVDWSHDQGAPLSTNAPVPTHCRVSGYVAPAVRFELRLPAVASWNGKFLLGACSGWCGQVYKEACVPGLARGYAAATTDGGHFGSSRFDGVWAFNNRQAEIDFSYRANHVVAQASKAIVKAYYGREARYSYIAGCSKGGHAGLMAAQRYPADFDGVIANGPVLDYQGANALRLTWIARAVTDADGRIVLDASRVPLIERSVMQACDGLDGKRDGLIDDPRRCKFDPATLLCSSGKGSRDCLAAKEVEALRRVYQPPRDDRGNVVYAAGTVPGSEGSWPGWLLPRDGDIRTRAYVGADQYLKFVGFDADPGPSFNLFSFDYDLQRLQTLSPIIDAIDVDLRAFAARGGKLIVMHGWADAAISPLMTVKYFDEMTEFMGGIAPTAEFARLYLLPGAYHCSGGVGPNALDALSALEGWRERGLAPGDLKTAKDANTDGVVEATGVVRPYQAASHNRPATPARSFKDCEHCPTMVVIPAGTGSMGTTEAEWRSEGYAKPPQLEMPAHSVTVPSFALSQFEVTRDEYARFAIATQRPDPEICELLDAQNVKVPVKGGSYRNTSLVHVSGKEPVSCVTWEDAVAYLDWLSQQTGRKYRLPTEAEWEYAARAGTTTQRYWQASEARDAACAYGSVSDFSLARGLGGIGVSDAPENIFQCNDEFVYLAPVGSFKANAFGLHDMLGNVSEWVQDCAHASYQGAPGDGSEWQGGCMTENGKLLRIARGGAFGTDANKIRAAWRARLDSAAFHTGFRAAMSVEAE